MSELPLYRSFEEDGEAKCILCGTDQENPIEFGDKFTYENITIHYFCAVSFSFLRLHCMFSFSRSFLLLISAPQLIVTATTARKWSNSWFCKRRLDKGNQTRLQTSMLALMLLFSVLNCNVTDSIADMFLLQTPRCKYWILQARM